MYNNFYSCRDLWFLNENFKGRNYNYIYIVCNEVNLTLFLYHLFISYCVHKLNMLIGIIILLLFFFFFLQEQMGELVLNIRIYGHVSTTKRDIYIWSFLVYNFFFFFFIIIFLCSFDSFSLYSLGHLLISLMIRLIIFYIISIIYIYIYILMNFRMCK